MQVFIFFINPMKYINAMMAKIHSNQFLLKAVNLLTGCRKFSFGHVIFLWHMCDPTLETWAGPLLRWITVHLFLHVCHAFWHFIGNPWELLWKKPDTKLNCHSFAAVRFPSVSLLILLPLTVVRLPVVPQRADGCSVKMITPLCHPWGVSHRGGGRVFVWVQGHPCVGINH